VLIFTINLPRSNNIARKILHGQLAKIYFCQFVLKIYIHVFTNNTSILLEQNHGHAIFIPKTILTS
jgi:hypothetical protein